MSRKQKQHAKNSEIERHAQGGLARAATWPIYEVLLSHNWDHTGVLVSALVARRSPLGKIAAGAFLVDLACLGAKSVSVRLYKTPVEYQQDMRRKIMNTQPLSPADINLVAKIIVEGVAYARSLGFNPDPVYQQAVHLLSEAHLEACDIAIPLGGSDGKPFFVAGPYDNVQQIIDRLTRTVGVGNFHYMIQVGSDMFDQDLE